MLALHIGFLRTSSKTFSIFQLPLLGVTRRVVAMLFKNTLCIVIHEIIIKVIRKLEIRTSEVIEGLQELLLNLSSLCHGDESWSNTYVLGAVVCLHIDIRVESKSLCHYISRFHNVGTNKTPFNTFPAGHI